MKHSEQRDILIYAFRYALGRMTYAVHTVSEIIIRDWDTFSEFDKSLFKKEIKEAIRMDCIGMKMDRKQWSKILELE